MRKATLGTFVAAICLLTADVAVSQSSATLFGDFPGAARSSSLDPARPQVLRSRLATIQADRLDRAVSAPSSDDAALVLNLFDDVSFHATRERTEQNVLGFTTWVGKVSDVPLSTVTLSRQGDVVAGQVSAAGRTFEIHTVAPSVYRIDEINAAALPNEAVPLRSGGLADYPPPSAELLARPQATSVVDVLVFYTTAVRTRLGDANARARISLAIADGNTAMDRSNTGGSLRLVGAEHLPFTESADVLADLDRFAAMTQVAQRRSALKADLVSLVVDQPYSSACGIAYLGPNPSLPVSVVAEPCFPNYTLAHEIGHNLGAGHAPEDGETPQDAQGWRTYSFAYKHLSPLPAFRTVMAYACENLDCERVLYFSNPNVLRNGQVTGTSGQDNARTLREAFPIVADFMTAPPTAPPAAVQNARAVVSGSTIFLSWQASATATSYRVLAGSVPGASDLFNGAVGTNLSLTATVPIGTYYVRIVAENGLGPSPASEELTVVVTSLTPLAGPARALSGQAYGDTVVLTWLPPNAGPIPNGYVMEVGSASGSTDLAVFGVGGPYFSVGGVPQGRYYIRVRSTTQGGASAPSNEIALNVGAAPGCQPPTAPMGLHFTRSGSLVTVYWVAPSTGTAPFSFIVDVGSASGQSNLFSGNVGPVTTVSAGLAPGPYYVRVRTQNACGTSSASNEVFVQVP